MTFTFQATVNGRVVGNITPALGQPNERTARLSAIDAIRSHWGDESEVELSLVKVQA